MHHFIAPLNGITQLVFPADVAAGMFSAEFGDQLWYLIHPRCMWYS